MTDKELQVYAPCSPVWLKTSKLKIVNVESNFFNQDVLTFECPYCLKEHKSIAVIVDKE